MPSREGRTAEKEVIYRQKDVIYMLKQVGGRGRRQARSLVSAWLKRWGCL